MLLLAALGLAITFGLMGVINMAHGEMLMLGAYTTYVVQQPVQAHAPGYARLLPARGGAGGVRGLRRWSAWLLERSVMRFLYGRPLETLLATWGISLILIQTVRLMFGAQNVDRREPELALGRLELMRGVVLPYSRIAHVAVRGAWWSSLVVRAAAAHARSACRCARSPRTARWRAASASRTSRVDMRDLRARLGRRRASAASRSRSSATSGPELGQSYIVDSLHGRGARRRRQARRHASSRRVGLGVVNKFLEPVSGAVLGKIFVLGFIILFIQRRPQGMFALKGRAAEA